jgi:hypothetical protein
MGYNKIPRQKLSRTKKNKLWGEQCVQAYIELSNSGRSSGSSHRDEISQLYEYYNGDINKADYKYVLEPYGKARKNFPSQMRNYPIIKPIIDLLLGEKSKRPLNFTVTVQNADSVSTKEDAKKELIYKNLQQQFINEMNARGTDTGVQTEEVEMPAHIADQFDVSYVDNRAIKGQNAINYIMQEQEIYDKLQKAWFHFLVSGEAYTHRGVRNKEPFYDILNPLDVDFDLDPDLDFVEDGDWATVRKAAHASTVIDMFYEDLDPDEILSLEDPANASSDSQFLYSSTQQDSNAYRNRLISVIYVCWKSRKRIGFVKFQNPETGEIEEQEVEDGFRLPPELKEMGATLDWIWVNEVWGGHEIDGRIYTKIHPLANQRNSLDNSSTCKLPINGRKYSNVNSSNISLVKLGIPYQLNYNIYKYRLELAISKSKDMIAQFDINMIPKKWDMDKFMYYVEGTGIAWVDYNKEGIALNPQHQTVMDLSIKTIEQYIVLLDSIMQEWEKLSGVNRQRQGQVGAYEGKSTSQQAIVQSSHITEDLFRKFNRLEQRDLQALLDYSKEAWIDGKKAMYVMPDGTTDFLDINSMSHMESQYGVFLSDSGKDQDKLDNIKNLSQSMIQNGVPASTIAEMFDAESFTQIKLKIKTAEKSMQALEEQQKKAEQEAQQARLEHDQDMLDREDMNKEKDRETQIEVAMIHARDNDTNAKLNLEKGMRDLDLKEQELSLKERDSTESERSNRSEENIKRKDSENKVKISKSKSATK